MNRIHVVAAVLRDDAGRVLVAARPKGKDLEDLWEFPGGKVEPGEEASSAIIREIREELGCEITISRALKPFVHDYRTVVITMIPFVCTLTPGSPAPHPHEHVAIAWTTLSELRAYDLAAADWPVVDALVSR